MNIKSFKTLDYVKYSFPLFIVLAFLALVIQFKGDIVSLFVIYITYFIPIAILLTLVVGGIAFFNRCEKCGRCFNKIETRNDIVNTRTEYEDIRKQKRVGTQVHRVPHPDGNLRPIISDPSHVVGITDIYVDVIIRVTTI